MFVLQIDSLNNFIVTKQKTAQIPCLVCRTKKCHIEFGRWTLFLILKSFRDLAAFTYLFTKSYFSQKEILTKITFSTQKVVTSPALLGL